MMRLRVEPHREQFPDGVFASTVEAWWGTVAAAVRAGARLRYAAFGADPARARLTRFTVEAPDTPDGNLLAAYVQSLVTARITVLLAMLALGLTGCAFAADPVELARGHREVDACRDVMAASGTRTTAQLARIDRDIAALHSRLDIIGGHGP